MLFGSPVQSTGLPLVYVVDGQLFVARTASEVPFTVKAAAAQAANVFQVLDSADSVLFAVGPGGDLVITGSTTIIADQTVDGDLTVMGDFAVALTSTFTGAASFDASLSVGGASSFSGAVTMAQNLSVNGNVSVGGQLSGQVIYLVERGSDPAGQPDNGGIFTKEVSGVTELFYVDSSGNAEQLSNQSASVPTQITVANEAADASCFVGFFTAASGDLGPKTNAGLTFDSTSGVLTATGFSGPLTGNVTGNVSGTAATVTGAAQANITSLGTLTALQVDNLNLNGNEISSTAGTDLLITPLAGQQIVLDGTIIIDAGVVTGATSITSTAFVGALTGNADTVTGFSPAGGSLALAGADALTLTTTAATDVTLPTTGTLATLAGTETLSGKTLTEPKFADLGFVADANGNEMVAFDTVAAAVPYLQISNNSTGLNPVITGAGEANTGIDFLASGTGAFRFLGNATQAAELRLYEDTTDGTNYTAFKVGAQAADITYTLPTAIGAAGTYLRDVAGNGVLSWASVAGGGDVVGPGASTDNAIVRWNLATGTSVQDSDAILDDSENLSGIGNITGKAAGITITGGTGAGDDLLLLSTSNGTKGYVAMGSLTAGVIYDEANTKLSIGAIDTMTVNGTAVTSRLVTHNDTAGASAGYEVHRYSDTAAFGPTVYGARARGTIGAEAVVQSGDMLFTLPAVGFDGTDYALSARINMEVDGTPGNNDMPGRIVFLVSPDGGQTPAEAMRISQDKTITTQGNVNLAASTALQVATVPILSDAAGTMTLSNVDALDATTESTIEAAIDALANLVSIQGKTVTLAGDFITSGAFSLTLTQTAATNVTLPTTGTLATLAGTEELDNKTLDTSVAKGTWTASGTWTTPAFTAGGSITLAENSTIALDPAGSADGKFTGITVTGTAGYTQAFGDLVYLDPTDSRWEAVDANAASGADGDARGMLGMVVSAGTDGNACTILLNGIIRADAKFPAFTVNNPIYCSETAAAVTQTQPTTTDVVIRIVGSALTADEMYFNPDWAFITHT